MAGVGGSLSALAAYNAGAGRIERMRREATRKGFDPNVWFGNVEVVTAAQIGAETVRYVSDICRYYVAYHLAEQEPGRRKALDRVRPGQGLNRGRTGSSRLFTNP